MEREKDQFAMDDFASSANEDDFETESRRPGRRKRTARKATEQREKAAWSKLEDVLAEKRLRKQLEDNFDDYDWN